MSDPIVYGFPRSTFVNIIRLILTYKDVAYSFHDLEPVMGSPGIWRCTGSIAFRFSGTTTSPSTRRARSPPMSTRPSAARR